MWLNGFVTEPLLQLFCSQTQTFMDFLENLSYVQILVGTVISFLFGWLWYSPLLFLKPWKAYNNMTDENMKTGMVKGLLGGLVLTLLTGIAMDIALRAIKAYGTVNAEWDSLPSLAFSLKFALVCGLGFVFVWLLMPSFYARKPLSVSIIDGLYGAINLVIMALVISGWDQVFG